MVVLLLAALLAQATTDLFDQRRHPLGRAVLRAGDEYVDAISGIHRPFWWVIVVLSLLHIGAVLAYVAVAERQPHRPDGDRNKHLPEGDRRVPRMPPRRREGACCCCCAGLRCGTWRTGSDSHAAAQMREGRVARPRAFAEGAISTDILVLEIVVAVVARATHGADGRARGVEPLRAGGPANFTDQPWHPGHTCRTWPCPSRSPASRACWRSRSPSRE